MGILTSLKTRIAKKQPGPTDKQALSTSSRTDAPAKSPTTIFSLPPELLDQIFAHLLDPRHVQYDPRDPEEPEHPSKAYAKHGGTAHTYRFHPNILRVNKALGAAAEQYWHSKCIFVLLDYNSVGLTAMMHRLDVPIIADQKAKSARHSFHIRLSWSVGPFSTIADRRRAKMKSPSKGSALLLYKDLGRLLKVLNFHCSFLAPKRVSIIGGHDPVMTKGSLSKYTPGLTLKRPYDSARPQPLYDNEWHEFVGSFRKINGFRYRIEDGTKQLRPRNRNKTERTIPDLIWPRAIWWDRFEAAYALKQEADHLVRMADYEAARARYEFIVCWADCDSNHALRKIDTSRDSVLLAAQERWLLLLFDCCVSQSWLHLRLQKVDAQYPRCGHRLTTILAKLEVVWGGTRSVALDSVWSHVVLLAVVCILTKGRKSAARVPMIASELILLRKTWGQEIEEHEAHDHALVEDAISQTSTGVKLHIPIEKLSAKVLPARIFDSQSEAKMPERPEGLIGWQDQVHLARLTEKEQVAIATAQKKVSSWDLNL